MFCKRRNLGQHLGEIAMIIAMITGAFLVIRLYTMRTFQARYKDGADYLISNIRAKGAAQSKPNLANMPSQYDPYYNEADMTETRREDITRGFPNTAVNSTINRTGVQKVNVPGSAD